MSDRDDLAAWLQLMLTDGVGTVTARDLLLRFGPPSDILSAGFSALQKCVPEKIALALAGKPDTAMQLQIEKTLAWAAEPGNHVLTLADANYPQALLSIADPPPLLYAKGRTELLSRPGVAIVGSRNATAQGMQNAERFAQTLSNAGLCVISGLALGIDAAAHAGACSASPEHGSTIAITGTGLDLVYPAKHRALAHRIAEHGCLLSEYPIGTAAIASNFPRRNRLISGMSLGVLVVEAALQSGSLITARSALEQGREVFAIPGSIHSPLAKGCHQLIRQGAKLVESAQDVLEELQLHALTPAAQQAVTTSTRPTPNAAVKGQRPSTGVPAAVDEQARQVMQAAGHDPTSVDQLAERTGLAASEIQATLLLLELDGSVERMSDGRYQKLTSH
jgi:DNA processing protein